MSIAFTMALAAGLLLLLVFFCNGAYGADANNELVCKENYFLHYDITAVISCEYERSFLTVRWYFNGAEKSFLRFDGETLQKRGSGYDSGEYDIQDDGSMVIKRTDVQHEGTYKIAVLHSDGSSSQENIAIFIVGADANNELVCKENYFLHNDITAVISCEYERSFLTVRWYFNGAEKSFLRFDGETLQKRGSGYDSGEYDIQDDGSMVIKRTDLKHEGTYKIAVLHSDGSSSQENIAIFIVGPLKSLIIHDCGSRRIELCPGELFGESSDAILCIAKDSWLPVDLTWQTLGPNGIAVDVSSQYTLVHKRDNVSSLFTSTSTLQYEKESFVLQQFTCVASDRTNKTSLTKSLLVSGDDLLLRSSLAERSVNEGSSFQMKCPVASKPLAQLHVTFFDGISKLLMETNTTTSQQVCVDESCQLNNDTIVVFDNVSHKQEGVYRCISSDGTTAEAHVLRVTVLISPANAAVHIEGCESTESCTRNGTRTGILTCSVSGFRPPVDLTMTDDNYSKLDVKLTNHRRETTTDPESGTSESYLTVEYEMIGCNGTASLTCSARPDKFARKINPSKITIATGKVKCMDDPVTEKKGEEGLTLVIFAVFAIIVVAIVVLLVILLWTLERGISKRGGKQSEETESRLLSVGQNQTQLIAVKKFLAGCEESDLFSMSDRTKVIRLAVEKLPPETSLSLLAEIFSLHQITVEEFIAGTKFLLDENKITAKGILATLKEVSKSKYPGAEIAEAVIQFILKNLMTVDEVFRQIGFKGVGKQKIHHPYYLQAIQGMIGDVTVQQKNTLRSLFDKILTKATDDQVLFREEAINKMKNPDLRKKFLRVLLLNVQNKWMKTDECIAILTASEQKGQINETDLEDISDCLINQSWLDKVNTMDLLAECLHASLMSESTYKKTVTSIKKKGKITKDDLADALLICSGKNT